MASSDQRLEHTVFARRWVGFVLAIWLMALSGSYGFANYSTALKDVLGLNQKQLNRLSVAKDLGDSSGILAGILCNYVSASTLLCIGATVSLVGNGTQWLVVSQIISPPPYWIMFIMAAVAGNTLSWMNTSVFTLSVRNFPRNRGPVAGLFKAYMGLSAAIYSHFCDYFFSSSASKYLLMLSTAPPTFCLITAVFFRQVPAAVTAEDDKVEQQSLFMFTVMSIALALLLVVKSLVPGLQEGIAQSVVTALLFVLLAAPALVPIVLFFKVKKKLAVGVSYLDDGVKPIAEDELTKPLLDQSEIDVEGDKSSPAGQESGWLSRPVPRLGEDWFTLSLFKTWHSYVLYATLFFGTGAGMSFANNLGQVGQSFGFSTVTLFTSLFSLGNFFGRITSGNVSEYFLKTLSTPRPAWIGVVKLPMIVLFTWLSFGSGASLYAGSLIVGFSHGSLITLTIPTISEFYGLKYFGTNYMVLNTHILAGSIVFSGIIAGYLYDLHATYEDGESSLTCYGASCYGTTFRIYAGCLAVALLLDVLLTFSSRHLYRRFKDINTHVKDSAVHKSIEK
ncbi:hypothetical protein GOP47_0008066 [Adiantum capillus-veneris]|uniref:Nodulin-like domain-containing protein n=1 Tax=Adiantum capillus-veneris TaxID=13818 RepID=A0A9D4ZK35_ADICA|nr:hypothetical protein GOP47_0008066 [Adiantum capillus-veneris]